MPITTVGVGVLKNYVISPASIKLTYFLPSLLSYILRALFFMCILVYIYVYLHYLASNASPESLSLRISIRNKPYILRAFGILALIFYNLFQCRST